MIPSGRKLTPFHSNDAHEARVGGPLLRAVVQQVERGEVAANIDAVYRSSRRSTPTAGWRRTRRQASSSCCRTDEGLVYKPKPYGCNGSLDTVVEADRLLRELPRRVPADALWLVRDSRRFRHVRKGP